MNGSGAPDSRHVRRLPPAPRQSSVRACVACVALALAQRNAADDRLEFFLAQIVAAITGRHRSACAQQRGLKLLLGKVQPPAAYQLAQKSRIVGMRAAALAPEQNLRAYDRLELAPHHLRRDSYGGLGGRAAFEVADAFLFVPVAAGDGLPRRQRDPAHLLSGAAQIVQRLELDAGLDAVHLEQRCGFLERYAPAALADADDRRVEIGRASC